MKHSNSDSKPSNTSPKSASSPSPKAKGLDFEPLYAVEGGVEHTFTGTLYVPTAAEFERMERQRQMTPRVNPVCIAVEDSKLTVAVHKGRMQGRVTMSAGDMIRLGATKNG